MNASARCTRAGHPTRCRCCWTCPTGTRRTGTCSSIWRGSPQVEQGLVDLHKQIGAVCYCEMGGFYSLYTDDPEVKLESRTEHGVFSTRITTPLGTIHEERVFNPDSYSYGIRKYLLESTDEFPIVEFLMERLQLPAQVGLVPGLAGEPRRAGLSLRPVAVLGVGLPDGAQHGRGARPCSPSSTSRSGCSGWCRRSTPATCASSTPSSTARSRP